MAYVAKTNSLTVRLTPPEREALERGAKADGRAASTLLRKLALDWLRAGKWLPSVEQAQTAADPTPGEDGAEGMKAPGYLVRTMQEASDAGINPFGAQLVAESFADVPERFGDETVIVVARAHSGQPVFLLLSKRHPTKDQFKDWPR